MRLQYVTMALAAVLIAILAGAGGYYLRDSRESAPAPTYITVPPSPLATTPTPGPTPSGTPTTAP
ncbi:hypothetical protein OG618_36920 (plasmid) [Kitasatospora sp. NBC_01246]|uniref:hypothetical protein n=1 Tax=Kitasatospora sp. NBC_01246 TaxID=2903570 RepID=UPI002E3225BF|nr:hypothetical protein [Kitasatospora sp. NBC_01246]